MLGQPIPPSAYDLRFAVLGIPVRVHPVFWLTAAMISWRPGRLDLSLLGALCVFVSVLIHELGHALMNRRLGWNSQIVLEFFGGYATTQSHSRRGNILVAAAGPAAGLLLYAALWLFVKSPAFETVQDSQLARTVLDDLLVLNWGWSLMNLIPVWPLDGGHIAREVIGSRRRDESLVTVKLSILVAVAVALWAALQPAQVEQLLMLDAKFFVILFAYLAFQNFQILQHLQRGYW